MQEHGTLIVVSCDTHLIEQVSENIIPFFGVTPQEVVGKEISALGDLAFASSLISIIASLTGSEKHRLFFRPDSMNKHIEITCTRSQNSILLECEVIQLIDVEDYRKLQAHVSTTLRCLAKSPTLLTLCEEAAARLRLMTDFDRVIIYKFDEQWNGEVLAENRAEGAETFLGLRFPASDIPAQARKLYTVKTSRYIPDVDYVPSPIYPIENPQTHSSTDLTLANLRSISPVHLEYLRNMGLRASMSFSLMQEGHLWGLISFAHTRGPRHVAKEVFEAVDLIREVISAHLAGKVGVEDLAGRRRVDLYLESLSDALHHTNKLRDVLWSQRLNLLALVEADGAALIHRDNLMLIGQTPTRSAIVEIVKVLSQTQAMKRDGLSAVHDLPHSHPELLTLTGIFCGTLIVQLSKQSEDEWLVYFRKELIHTVDWGGDPNKASEPDKAGLRIHPRKSFDLWREEVRGQASPWRFQEKRAAVELRLMITEHLAQQTGRLEAINSELIRSNLELDSFAHAASHDLKEPLRGIQNYTQFLLREERGKLSDLALKRLDTVTRLTVRMNDLLDSLLLYAQVGRSELCLQENDLRQLVAETLEMLRPWLNERSVDVEVLLTSRPIFCDSVRVMEVLSNLITNAAKYNTRPSKKIMIGSEALNGQNYFFVRDNGIGISKENLELPFRLFKRLHPKEAFGGGAGTGLTLAKAIVARHGGKIHISSEVGVGTSIYFTLSSSPMADEDSAPKGL